MLLKRTLAISLCTSIIVLVITATAEVEFSNNRLEVQEKSSSTTQCILNIINNYFPCGSTIDVIGYNNDMINTLSTLERDMCYRLSVYLDFDSYEGSVRNDLLLISLNRPQQLKGCLHIVSRGGYWNPSAKVIMHVDKPINESMLQLIFDSIYHYRLFNTILIRKVTEQESFIYTYFPFANGNCGRKLDEIKKIGDCNQIEEKPDIFPNKHPDGYKNCTLVISAVEDAPNVMIKNKNNLDKIKAVGLEPVFLSIAAEREGFNMKFLIDTNRSFGFVMPDLTITGILGQIQDGTSDVAIGGLSLLLNRAAVFDYILGFNYPQFCLYTRPFDPVRWQNVYREFRLDVWIAIVVCFTIFTTLISILKYSRITSKKSDVSLIEYFIILLGYFFGNASQKLCNDKSIRSFIVFWIWFTFSISNFYVSELFSFITSNPREVNLIDTDYLTENGYIPCIGNGTREYFHFAFNESLPSDGIYRPECDTKEGLKAVAAYPNYYTIESDYSYELDKCSYRDAEGKSKIASWGCGRTILTVIYYYKGFPLHRELNLLAIRVFESGLILKQMRDISVQSQLQCQGRTKGFYKYRLVDLSIPFYLLFGGWAISFCIFILESLQYSLFDRSRNFERQPSKADV